MGSGWLHPILRTDGRPGGRRRGASEGEEEERGGFECERELEEGLHARQPAKVMKLSFSRTIIFLQQRTTEKHQESDVETGPYFFPK